MAVTSPASTSIARIYAYDAYWSAATLAILAILWPALNLLFGPMFDTWLEVVRLVQMGLAAGAVIYFGWTWNRPRPWVALTFSLVTIGLSVALVPWVASRWLALGRPCDAFLGVQIALISMPLVAPRYQWVGILLTGIFVAEAFIIGVQARAFGAMVPAGPLLSFAFGLNAVWHVILRQQRRSMATRHLLVEGEEMALERLGPTLASVRKQLGAELGVLTKSIQALGTTLGSGATDRAVGRLSTVDRQLRRLARTGLAAAPHPSAAAERRWRAGAAHLGATVFAMLTTILGAVAFLAYWGWSANRAFIALVGLIALGSTIYLVSTRDRPSERRAVAVSMTLFGLSFVVVTYNHLQFSTLGPYDHPFQPFSGHKVLMIGIALIAPLRVRTGIVLVLALTLNALAFYVIGFNVSRTPMLEPSATLLVALMAVGYLFMWEQRRTAAAQLLQAETETSSLRRHTMLFFSLRDQLNSPLQALVLQIARVKLAQPTTAALLQVESALARLIVLSNHLARLQDELPWATWPASLDSIRELDSTSEPSPASSSPLSST